MIAALAAEPEGLTPLISRHAIGRSSELLPSTAVITICSKTVFVHMPK